MFQNRGFFAGSSITKAAPAKKFAQCGLCGLYKGCVTPKMPPAGEGRRGVLFITGAPGNDEDESGVPLVGKPGQRLKSVLRGLGFDLDVDGWKTNAVICKPGKGRVELPEVGFCRPNVIATIKRLKPLVIVPLGVEAVNSIIGYMWKEDVGKMETWAGWNIPCQKPNVWVCPTWNPSQVLREDDPVIDRQFKNHLAKAISHTERPWPTGSPEWGRDVCRESDPHKAAEAVRAITSRRCGAVAWDYETNMLKPDGVDARIVSCAVAWGRREPEECIAFPWHGEVVPAMLDLLRSPMPKIASNLKFEDRWTRKEFFGKRVRGWAWDTMVAAHVLDNRPGITSVKFQAFVRLGAPVWNDRVEQYLKTSNGEKANAILREIDLNDLLLYNGLDALLEFRVAIDQITEMGCPIPWEV